MKIIQIRRKTTYRKRSSKKMFEIITRITYVKKYIFGLPVATIKKNKEMYFEDKRINKESMLFV
ncbi:hypothetical protein APS56_05125 [Pseudalgibacter alginicilyticus]|uniref:Uncharacterized protein n=1 Tax=Pseudalgibacter alginicilyticus TaxID=1736674 RepID=A0A0P0CVU9_9FLAO|nr:hypothetical protein [Pseudalgibacter alginicilyticus]ALJ04556.1 hypothetical protein APS56_05125 [Pseudalgibacter alginicilyticus]